MLFFADKKRGVLRSSRSAVFVANVWVPFLCFCAAVAFSTGEFLYWRLIFIIPLAVAGLFGMSVATLEIRGGVIRYKRFRRWKTISNEEIVKVRVEAPQFVGSVKLKRFLLPWNRLYFALDANLMLNPFREGEYRLITYLQNVSGEAELRTKSHQSQPPIHH